MGWNPFAVESNAASVGASIGAGLGSKAGPVGAGLGAGVGAASGYIAGALVTPCPVRRALPDGGKPQGRRVDADERREGGPSERPDAGSGERRDAASTSCPSHVEIPVTE
jgi:hypothetical protein